MGFQRIGPRSLLLRRLLHKSTLRKGLCRHLLPVGFISVLLSSLFASPALADCPIVMHQGLPRPAVPDGVEVDPPFDTREACPAWRWTGLRHDIDAPCPTPQGAQGVEWKVRPLFESSSGEIPRVLRPFCVYEIETDPGDPPVETHVLNQLNMHLEGLLLDGALDEVWSTCAAVAPMSGTSQGLDGHRDVDWQVLRENFLAQAQQLPSGWHTPVTAAEGGSISPQSSEGLKPVRLAILDTQPDIPDRGTSDHGYALAEMARDLLYPCIDGADGLCERAEGPVQIAHRLAMPIDKFDWQDPSVSNMNLENGGYFGTIDQLAEAVWQELEAWPGRCESRLVLNLSLGWVGEHFGGLEDRVSHMPGPVQALFRVLEVAACRDVLVIAAAGNRVGGPDVESGPLMPAFWNQRRAPREEECRVLLDRFEGERPKKLGSFRDSLTDKPKRGDRPMLYAVGGVRHEGSPLINARPDSESSIAAYSDHSVVLATRNLTGNSQLPSIFVGTSIGTTVVATAAAAAWTALPDWSRHRLMDLVESTGDALGRQSDVFLRAPSEVKRVGVCSAFAAALKLQTDSALECGPLPSPAALGAFEGTADLRLSLEQGEAGIELCRIDGFSGDGSPVENPCPFHQFYGIRSRPWTGPMPAHNPCMGCDIRPPPPGFQAGGDWTLRLQIDPTWSGGRVFDPLLQLGSQAYRLNICRQVAPSSDCPLRKIDGKEMCCSMAPGDVLTLGGIPESLVTLPDGRRPAAAIYFDTRAGSIESPVYISFRSSGGKS